jgi:hypothetical protein
MKKNFCFRKWWVLVPVFLWPLLSFSQEERELVPVSRTYALTHATIVQAPGRKIEDGTVVIKNGLIHAVGKNVAIPADAIIIKADSLFIYAGFIDGLSHTGLVKPKEETPKDKVKDPGNPPNDRAGITPEADVRSFLIPTEKSIEELRSVGFTTAHVVPYGRMLPGSGSIIQLSGTASDRMVLLPKTSLYAEFTVADRIYPNTVLGIMAKWRELYRQATLSKSYETLYASNRSGLERPATDRVVEAFYPVIDKRTPVFFSAAKFLEAQRALMLQSDLGFSLVLGDLKEGWDMIPKIKSSGTKVFLSLDLPEDKKEVKKTDKKDQPVDQEKETLEKRRLEFVGKYNGQASTFQKAGVVYGFSALSVKTKDIQPNLRKMIKAGLTEDQALAGLTTNPAQLLGLSDRLGSVDNGKIANLVLSNKPYFNEKAKVRYVFVEGVLYKIDATEAAKANAATAVDVAGGWTVTTETAEGKSEEKVVFKKSDTSVSGSITGGRILVPTDLTAVSVEGNNLTYSYTIKLNGQDTKVEVKAVVEGESFKGTATVGDTGDYPVEGKREPNR